MFSLDQQSLSKAQIWPKSMSEQWKKQECHPKAVHMGQKQRLDLGKRMLLRSRPIIFLKTESL